MPGVPVTGRFCTAKGTLPQPRTPSTPTMIAGACSPFDSVSGGGAFSDVSAEASVPVCPPPSPLASAVRPALIVATSTAALAAPRRDSLLVMASIGRPTRGRCPAIGDQEGGRSIGSAPTILRLHG